jgi:hypothetical protein
MRAAENSCGLYSLLLGFSLNSYCRESVVSTLC